MGIHIMPPLYKIVMPGIYTVELFPDKHPEVSTVDGEVQHVNALGLTWANLIAAPGTVAIDGGAGIPVCQIYSSTPELNVWESLVRGIYLFDATVVPPGAVYTEIYLDLYGTSKSDALNILPDVGIYFSNPASNIALVPGDYHRIGSFPLASPIAYADWVINGMNRFTFTGAARALVPKNGIIKIGTRNANYDVAGREPTWALNRLSGIYASCAERAIVGQIPRLTLVYSIG